MCARAEGIVDEQALADVLTRGRFKGAVIDVFENEPIIKDSPLLGLGNVLLTPHISGGSNELIKRAPIKVAENLNRICEGKPPLRVVNI